MTGIRFETRRMGFAQLPQFGEEDPFARINAPGTVKAGFPMWTWDRVSHASRWDERNPAAALDEIHRQNPDLPKLPPDASFVIAGQQVGLLLGPLYTFLKAVSAITLSREIRRRAERPVYPLFWMASEDHDVLEVNRLRLNGRDFVEEYKGELRRGAVPQVGDIPIPDAREPLLAFLRETLPATEFTSLLVDAVASADFSSYATAFRDLLRWLFSDWELRIVDPRALRRLTGPPLAALAERWPEVVAALQQGSTRVRSARFEAPLESPGLFEIVKGKRVAVECSAGSARVADGPIGYVELASEIRQRSADFSPNAALRPVLQDAALPVAVTFGGPSELTYLWQIDPIYGVIGVDRSLLLPRISATFVESRIQRIADKIGLWPDRLFEARRVLESASYRSDAPDDQRTASLAERAEALLEEIDAALRETKAPWLEKSRERLAGQIEKILSKMREDRNEEIQLVRSRLERIAESLLPGNRPQERGANPFEFLNLYGKDFVRLSIETLDPLCKDHQVVLISTNPEGQNTHGS